MRHLFSAEGEAALARTVAAQPLLAFDFDGTLAPIVARPENARMSLAVALRLEALSRRLPVAIVSGRSAADVRARLPFEPRFVVGNHGAEDPLAPAPIIGASAFGALRARLAAHRATLGAAGVTVEDKRHSIALHYRLAPDREAALAAIDHITESLDPALRRLGGKMVVNIVAAAAPDKAEAVARLVAASGAEAALFAGDDANDEPVFTRAGPDWLTIRIGRDEPRSRAQFFLDDPAEVAQLLDRILMMTRETA